MLIRILSSVIIVGSSFCISCNQPQANDSALVASAYGNKLYLNQITGLSSENLSKSDSSSIIDRHMDSWLMEEILYKEAKNKISNSTEIDALVESYRKSVFIHKYEEAKLSENMNSLVTNAEIDTFYNRHKDQYLLDESITKVLFVKVPEEMNNDKLISLWKTENLLALKTFVNGVSGVAILDLDKWHYLAEIKQLMPEELMNKINFSKRESYSLTKDGHHFLVRILDHVKVNEEAPKSFALPKIRQRLIHDNSEQFLKKWKKELYQNKIQGKDIQITSSQ